MGAQEYLDKLGSSPSARRTPNIDYQELAERLARIAWAWNNDPDHVAHLLGDDDLEIDFANAAICVLRAATVKGEAWN